jgi:uncharacterized protein YidB (DUF937 family)
MKKKFFGISAAVVAVMALALGAVGVAGAAAPEAARGEGEGRGGAIGDYMKAEVAEILGLTVEELEAAKEAETPMEDLVADAGLTEDEFKAALEAAFPDAVAAALADGAITEEEAEAILERGFRPGGKGGKGGHGGGPLGDYIKDASADILGLTVEELEAAREAGTTREELLDNAGLTEDEFKQAMEDALPGILDQAVEDGVITAEQAEQIEENGLRPPHKGHGKGGKGNGERPERPEGFQGPQQES